MASRSEHPDQALAELERVAGLLETELAGWRRRCLKAESLVEEAKHRVPDVTSGDLVLLRGRISEVESENHRLRERIAAAREQLEQLKTRLRFVGDQVTGDIR